MADTRRFNATTDLGELQAVLARAPAGLLAIDVQDLALSFNLDRPVVVEKDYERFEDRARRGDIRYLIISDRALATRPADRCMRHIARGMVTGRPFTVLDPKPCGDGASSPTLSVSGAPKPAVRRVSSHAAGPE
jgi:hypothetical protein